MASIRPENFRVAWTIPFYAYCAAVSKPISRELRHCPPAPLSAKSCFMSSSRRQYPFHLIEPKWQKTWDEQQAFRAFNPGEPVPGGPPFGTRHELLAKLSARKDCHSNFTFLTSSRKWADFY